MNDTSPYTWKIPESQQDEAVKLWSQPIILPTYSPYPADSNPMFFEKRVYQGSCGKVYPLPYTDKIADAPENRKYTGLFLENEYVRFLILPELGGRIQLGQDKTNGDYDFFYRNDVIKPALVGLAGPWLSGGVEFNWPQHHRPATFMPVQYDFETESDGAKTLWLSDHDPMERMKALLGFRLKPGSSVLEARVRLYNRNEEAKTFLWWANVAAEVHDEYQSFFPPDVTYVADHAARAMTEFPESKGVYYGIDYAPGTDISRYRNIPVPTSYMVMETEGEFFGGYDYKKKGGFVHLANKHISPGKKQWTWGNADFGRSWDRNLTDSNGPYVELMAGVYTNNQPDFTYLMPGETKEFSQFWFPIQAIGTAQFASSRGALHLSSEKGMVHVGVSATSAFDRCRIALLAGEVTVFSETADIAPGRAFTKDIAHEGTSEELRLEVTGADGQPLMAYRSRESGKLDKLPQPAQVTPPPSELHTNEELYLAGEHLYQYRHPTRYPEDYWLEALNRDPGDLRCNTAMGNHYLRRMEYGKAEDHFRRAIKRLTVKHPNPVDGEAFYGLGLALKHQDRIHGRVTGRHGEAYAAFYKSTWNFAWRAAGYHETALLDMLAGDLSGAEEHFRLAIDHNASNFLGRILQAAIYRKTGRGDTAVNACRQIIARDPLFFPARNELSIALTELGRDAEAKQEKDEMLRLMGSAEINYVDMVTDYLSAGLYDEALMILDALDARSVSGFAIRQSPFPLYLRAWILCRIGRDYTAVLQEAARHDGRYFFPSSSWEETILSWSAAQNHDDASAPYYLGSLYYDRKRKDDAIASWEEAVKRGCTVSTAFRNLGIAYFNHRKDESRALDWYAEAQRRKPEDGRILFEFDQLKRKVRAKPEQRLAFLLGYPEHIARRDDLAIEVANLLCIRGRCAEALNLLKSRTFQPWEGGEGQAVGVWTTANLLCAEEAERKGELPTAFAHCQAVLSIPQNLGETWHPLQNQSRVYYKLGTLLEKMGKEVLSHSYFEKSASATGDFSTMAVQAVSENTYYTALSLIRLGKTSEGESLFNRMIEYGRTTAESTAEIDYFATSLPLLLVFNDDIQARSEIHGRFLMALGYAGLGDSARQKSLADAILTEDPCHPVRFHLREYR